MFCHNVSLLYSHRCHNVLRDDDDINDVATMGGVNLTEESRNILATSSELMAGQMRSCKEEAFLSSAALHTRLSHIGTLSSGGKVLG